MWRPLGRDISSGHRPPQHGRTLRFADLHELTDALLAEADARVRAEKEADVRRQAIVARLCSCPHPLVFDDETCARCGRVTP